MKQRPRHRHSALPPTLAPLGLAMDEAAAYIGVSPTKFQEMVADRRMPFPKRIDGRRVWSRPQLDKAFAALPDCRPAGVVDDEHAADVWSDVAV
jgi:excisionase family DNA binding protein